MIPTVYPIRQTLSLSVCRTEKFKSGMLSVSAVLPIRQESVWKTSLLLSVLRRGTEKYPTLEALNRRLDYLYGTELSIRNFYRGDFQIIGFSAELLDASYLPRDEDTTAEILDVMCQILFHPLLDENGLLLSRYVESEKQLQCDAIRAAKNNPRAYANDRFRALMYENEPCGFPILGTEDEVMALTPEELTAHWRALIRELFPHFFYVGAADPEALGLALEQSFGAALAGACLPVALPKPCVIRTAKPVRRMEEPLEVGQGQLILGFRTGVTISDPSFYACVVFNELLGMSPVSKLFVNVREKLSLCYSCSSTYHSHKGTLTVSAGLSRANRNQAEAEILAQVEAIRKGEITDEEMLAARSSLINAYRQIEDSPAAVESFYFSRSLAGAFDTTADCRKAFAAVTKEDVIAVAQGFSLDTVYFLDGLLDTEDESNEDD